MRGLSLSILIIFTCLSSLATQNKTWEISARVQLDSSQEPSSYYDIFEFSKDGKLFFASHNQSKYLAAYSSKSGKLLYDTNFSERIHFHKLSLDGKKLIVRLKHHDEVIVIDAHSGRKLYTVETENLSGYDIVAVSPNSDTFAIGDYNGQIKLYDLNTGDQLALFPAHKGKVKSVSYSLSGQKLVSSGQDGYVKTFDVKSKIIISSFKVANTVVYRADFSPDETYLFVRPARDGVKILDAKTGKLNGSSRNRCFEHSFYILSNNNVLCSGDYRYDQGLIGFVTYFSSEGRHIFREDANASSYDPHFAYAKYFVNTEKKLLLIEDNIGHLSDSNIATIYSLEQDRAYRVSTTNLGDRRGYVQSFNGFEFFASTKNKIENYSLSGELIQTLDGHASSIKIVTSSSDGLVLASKDVKHGVIFWHKN